MNCSRCNAVLPQGKLFCPQCGHLNEVDFNKVSATPVSKQSGFGITAQHSTYPFQWYLYSFTFGSSVLWLMLTVIFRFSFFRFLSDIIDRIPALILCGLTNWDNFHQFLGWYLSNFLGIMLSFFYLDLVGSAVASIISIYSVISLFRQKPRYKMLVILNIVVTFLVALLSSLVVFFADNGNWTIFIYTLGSAISSSYFLFYFIRENNQIIISGS